MSEIYEINQNENDDYIESDCESDKHQSESSTSSKNESDSELSIHEEIDEDHNENFEKYKISSRIVNKAMKLVLEKIQDGIKIVELAQLGDEIMSKEIDTVFRKSELKFGKGIAMPTSISINEIAGFNSPLTENKTQIKKGDVVKVEMGVHIDGFICLTSNTKYLSHEDDPNKIKIEKLLKAIEECKQRIKGVMKVDKNTEEIIKIFNEISIKYGVSLISADVDNFDHIPGVFSYQLRRGYIDSYNIEEENKEFKLIVPNKILNIKSSNEVFRTNDVMVIDIMFSTGSGKISNRDVVNMPSLYINSGTLNYNLKLKASRLTLNEFRTRAKDYPYSLRNLETPELEKKIKIGLKECVSHKLLEPFYVLSEKTGEFIAQSKFTTVIKFNKNHYL